MKQLKNIINSSNKKIIIIIAFCLLTPAISYNMETRYMKSDTKQFTHRYDLIAVDKIELRDASLNRMQPMKKHITISDPKTIEEILKGLDRSKKSFLTDNRPNYRIIFYKNNNSLLDIGYQNFVDRPYVRVKYKGEEDEYTINSGLFTILQQFIIENQ